MGVGSKGEADYELLGDYKAAIYESVHKVEPRMWSQHALRTSSCSDILLNNIAKSFNAWVLEAMEKPIMSCLEIIRRQFMNQFNQKKDGAATSTNVIFPKIVKRLDRNMADARNYISHWLRGSLICDKEHVDVVGGSLMVFPAHM
jgi:hypothetical protein